MDRQTIKEIDSNIFFYALYIIWNLYKKFHYFWITTQINTQFSNIKQKTAQKKKKKKTLRSGLLRNWAADRPTAPGPRPRRARPRSLSLSATDRVAPPVRSLSLTHGGSAATPATDSEALGLRARAHRLRLNSATPLVPLADALPHCYHLGHDRSGRSPWPTVGRPLGPGREQTNGVGRFKVV